LLSALRRLQNVAHWVAEHPTTFWGMRTWTSVWKAMIDSSAMSHPSALRLLQMWKRRQQAGSTWICQIIAAFIFF